MPALDVLFSDPDSLPGGSLAGQRRGLADDHLPPQRLHLLRDPGGGGHMQQQRRRRRQAQAQALQPAAAGIHVSIRRGRNFLKVVAGVREAGFAHDVNT